MGAVGETRAVRPLIEWSTAQRAKRGEVESGDQCFVALSTERALLAAIDGLGHGPEAAMAARRAVDTLEAGADETIVSLVRRCHDALQPTRGAVMGLASFGAWENGMQWLGIGNVEGVVVRAHAIARPRVERLLARGGVVGHRLPRLLVSTVALTRDDVVVLATDGIRADFADRLTAGEPPRGLADRILAAYGKELDDALVLVARYLGSAP